ncbi:hypothetical protein [Nocardia rhamnosiphila]
MTTTTLTEPEKPWEIEEFEKEPVPADRRRGPGAVAALLTHRFAPWLSDAAIGFAAALILTLGAAVTARRDKELTA